MRVLALLVPALLAAAALGQEATVTVRVAEAKIEDVVRDVAARAGLEVEVAGELRGRKITLVLEEIGARDALTLIAALCEGKLVEAEDGTLRIAPPDPEWLRRLNITIRGTWISLGTGEIPLARAIEKLAAGAGISIALDPEAPAPAVTIQAANERLPDVLDALTEARGLAWDLRWGLVFVATPERLAAIPSDDLQPDYEGLAGWARDRNYQLNAPISFAFEKTPLAEALAALGKGPGVEVFLAGEPGDETVTLVANGLQLRHALAALLFPRGLTFEVVREGIRVVPRDR